MFTGVFNYKIDEKGRLSVPSRFREIADGKFFVTYGLDNSLVVYDGKGFEDFVGKLKKADQFDPKVIRLKRVFAAGVPIQECDSHGRIKLLPSIISFAGIKKDVVLNGRLDCFEIWDKEKFEKQQGSDIADYPENTSAMINKLDV